MAEPREIVAALLAAEAFHDSIPPQTVSNVIPQPVLERFGAAAPPDDFELIEKEQKKEEEKVESNVIPFPQQGDEEREEDSGERKSSVALEIPFNTGRELPDERAYLEGLQLLHEKGRITPGLAIHVLNLSRLCSPAYALLSQTAEYRKEALDLAGQSVVAAERRIAHGLLESLITGEEFGLEDCMADYLEARSFLARALWHAGNVDDAIEQAMHCFEVDPEDPAVREDLFVMLFDTDRHEMVLRLLESFPGASVTEDLYHKALAALLEDPDSRESKKALRKAVSHNTHLASLFLGEEPKKSKKSSEEEAAAYESAYGFLWRREDAIFDLLEEIVLARR
jgi:tetratricopeptide (TPR) repeat protein